MLYRAKWRKINKLVILRYFCYAGTVVLQKVFLFTKKGVNNMKSLAKMAVAVVIGVYAYNFIQTKLGK